MNAAVLKESSPKGSLSYLVLEFDSVEIQVAFSKLLNRPMPYTILHIISYYNALNPTFDRHEGTSG